jgi:hypothetical protein
MDRDSVQVQPLVKSSNKVEVQTLELGMRQTVKRQRTEMTGILTTLSILKETSKTSPPFASDRKVSGRKVQPDRN